MFLIVALERRSDVLCVCVCMCACVCVCMHACVCVCVRVCLFTFVWFILVHRAQGVKAMFDIAESILCSLQPTPVLLDPDLGWS